MLLSSVEYITTRTLKNTLFLFYFNIIPWLNIFKSHSENLKIIRKHKDDHGSREIGHKRDTEHGNTLLQQ